MRCYCLCLYYTGQFESFPLPAIIIPVTSVYAKYTKQPFNRTTISTDRKRKTSTERLINIHAHLETFRLSYLPIQIKTHTYGHYKPIRNAINRRTNLA